MKLGALDQAGYVRLFKALLGTGYTQEDDGPHGAELAGLAKIAAMVSEAPDNVVRNMFVSHAVEALDEHDRMRALPTDANLTTAQRQARLVAFTRALPKLVRARLDQAIDRWLGVTSGETITPGPIIAKAHGCSHWGGLVVSRLEPSATLPQLRVIDAMLQRGLPARALSKRAGTRVATYAQPVDSSLLFDDDPSPDIASLVPIVAPFEKFPGEVITLDEWREIQAQLLWKPYKGDADSTTNHFTLIQGLATSDAFFYAEGQINSGATNPVDSHTSWQNRCVQVWLASDDTGFTDTAAAGVDHGFLGAAKLGTIATPYVHTIVGPGTAGDFQIRIDGTGRLCITNTSLGSRDFKMFVRITPPAFAGTLNDREPWLSLSTFSAPGVESMYYGSGVFNPTVVWGYGNIVDEGPAVRRVLYTGSMQRAADGDTPRVVTLDTSIDWRNRAVLVCSLGAGSNSAVLHAASHRIANGLGSATGTVTKVFRTNAGAASSTSAVNANQLAEASGNVWLYADSTTGHLMAEMKASFSANLYAHAFFMVTASNTLGAPLTTADHYPVTAGAVYPADVNVAQNYGCYAQGQASATAPVTLPALGTVVDGHVPPRPVSWNVRERLGDPADRLVEVRQKLYGQRKRLLSVGIPAFSTIFVDAFTAPPVAADSNLDQMDYRDRLVLVEGAHMTGTNISLGNPVPQNDSGAAKFCWVFYAGPYDDHTFTTGNLTLTFEFRRQFFQSRLSATNASASTRYLNLMVEATGFLGLTDRRLMGA
jgi:hypothetical protein